MNAFDVLVLVGTDHHPFDRLVRWVDDWAAGHPGQPRVLVQRGTSCAPARVELVEYLDSDELADLMAATPVIVSPGGPSTIAESRRNGKRPMSSLATRATGSTSTVTSCSSRLGSSRSI